jgi:UDP-glucuronate decarboxylase
VYGDGSQTRSFCYVDDLLDGLELLMRSPDHVIGPCNLGNPHEVTIRDIAARIIKQTGSRSTLDRRPLPQDDPRRRRPVIARALKLLGWQPRVSLDYGLTSTIGYFSLKLTAPKPVLATVNP